MNLKRRQGMNYIPFGTMLSTNLHTGLPVRRLGLLCFSLSACTRTMFLQANRTSGFLDRAGLHTRYCFEGTVSMFRGYFQSKECFLRPRLDEVSLVSIFSRQRRALLQ